MTEKDNIFGEFYEHEERTHTIEGITNQLEDISDDEVAHIVNELKEKAPEYISDDLSLRERLIQLDARRIFLRRTTIEKTIKMYCEV